MNANCLKLTTYFGERQRVGGRFLSDALLDLYAEHQVASSVVLRGIGGFGLRHHKRTDISLSLSEDPPIAVAAIDTAEVINGLLEPVLAIEKRGILTLERATLLTDSTAGVDIPAECKLTVYLGRKERAGGIPAHIAVCDLLRRHHIAGASVLLGVDGTSRGQRTRARFVGRNTDVPVMIIAIGEGARISAVIPELNGLLHDPVITLERVQICKRDGELLARPHALPGTDEHGLAIWQKLMVYTSEAALHDGEPIHRALVRRLREQRSSHGATVLRGIWGFHGDHKPHGDKLFQLTRRVPALTIIVDTPEHIAETFSVIDQVTAHDGLVTCEMVPAQLTVDGDDRRGGTGMARHSY